MILVVIASPAATACRELWLAKAAVLESAESEALDVASCLRINKPGG